MSELKVDKISPETATSLTVGTSGDTVTVPSGATLDVSNATVNLPTTLTVASELKTNKISPASGTTFTMGDSGDAFTIPSGVTFANSGTATGFGGALTKISSTTFTNQTNVSITSGIDSTYSVYIFKFIDIDAGTGDANLTFQVNASGQTGYNETITSTAFSAYQKEDNSAQALGYQTGWDQAQGTAFQLIAFRLKDYADACASGELHLFAPSSTTYVKHFYSTSNGMTGTETTEIFIGGYINTTSAIDDIQFKVSSGTFDGTIAMYGISKS